MQGNFALIVRACRSPEWGEVWEALGCEVRSFAALGIPEGAPDSVVWRVCQDSQTVLVTGNRNAEGPHSLELTIREHNDPTSLPVLTLADPRRITQDTAYADRVSTRFLDILLDIEAYRGTGRLYLP